MVTLSHRQARQASPGFLTTELFVAMAIITLALLPLIALYASESRLARACYERSVAMEIVDGEMELLLAGEWRSFATGTTNYPLNPVLRDHLPAGLLHLTLTDTEVRLVWAPDDLHHGGMITRTGRIR
jgi:hypothetical protein